MLSAIGYKRGVWAFAKGLSIHAFTSQQAENVAFMFGVKSASWFGLLKNGGSTTIDICGDNTNCRPVLHKLWLCKNNPAGLEKLKSKSVNTMDANTVYKDFMNASDYPFRFVNMQRSLNEAADEFGTLMQVKIFKDIYEVTGFDWNQIKQALKDNKRASHHLTRFENIVKVDEILYGFKYNWLRASTNQKSSSRSVKSNEAAGFRVGDKIHQQYQVLDVLTDRVVRAKDVKGDPNSEVVVIKFIESSGSGEVCIMKKLGGDSSPCVGLISSFKHQNHLCLVLESLHMNRSEVTHRFGPSDGLKLGAVRECARQLLKALEHLSNCGVLHTDIKPENILVDVTSNVIKVCDYGSAKLVGENQITPYLESHFYAAPEILLGLPYDHAVDIWSVGCCLFELYTGRVLFLGTSINDMLRLQMELKGPFPEKILQKGALAKRYFDYEFNFYTMEEDPVSNMTIKKLVNIEPTDIGSLVAGIDGEDLEMVENFKDLLEKMFILDPEKRITVQEALSHPFITVN